MRLETPEKVYNNILLSRRNKKRCSALQKAAICLNLNEAEPGKSALGRAWPNEWQVNCCEGSTLLKTWQPGGSYPQEINPVIDITYYY
jgi:hypothetical protein